jgi:hypothetical protein
MLDSESLWAAEVFGHAHLGDLRRTDRLQQVAAAAARTPGGLVTEVMRTSATKEGAFRLLENSKVDPAKIAEAIAISTAHACRELARVHVALDQSAINVTDRHNLRGLGKVGDSRRTRGLQVMTALVLDTEGMPLGIGAMRWFSRPDAPTGWGEHDTRPVEDRESALWLDAIDDVARVFSEHAPDTKPWFQIDRGGDFWRVFDVVREHGFDVTVRASHDRVVDGKMRRSRLSKALKRSAVLGRMTLSRPKLGRIVLEVRARRVTMLMGDEGRPRRAFDLWVVQVREVAKPKDRERITWKLLTTRPATTLADAVEVVRGYTMRWRVEEFHRTWKGGHCQLERSQLRSAGALMRWATILAAVATRVERLKQMSRTQGELSALHEFSQEEIDAAIFLSQTKKWKLGDVPTLHQVVDLIAQVGGYTGKSSGGPPGSKTIGRGMERIAPAAAMAAHLRRTSG